MKKNKTVDSKKTDKTDISDQISLRRQAEELLQQQLEKNRLDKEKEVNASKLVHELQVHQIELEMQNEELQKATDLAEAALKKYTLVFDQAPMGFVIIDSDGVISELNFTAAEILGDRHFSLPGTNIRLYAAQESKREFSDFLHKIYINHSKESCTIMLGSTPQSLRSIYIEGIIIEDDNECMLSLVDLSNFK